MKNKKAILVEYMNDTGEWVWYGVYINATLKNTLKEVIKEMGVLDKGEKFKTETQDQSSYLYVENQEVRAMEIDLIDLSK